MAEDFKKKAENFIADLEGIAEVINAVSKYQIQDIKHPLLTNYLLWRILEELKKRK